MTPIAPGQLAAADSGVAHLAGRPVSMPLLLLGMLTIMLVSSRLFSGRLTW